ncbi:DNA cytosine methyltransferase [Faucicola boevrei]|uniref:DNA cytosine methyltransferase n=1 Tax=Faucicola boevrei TaxID=346665 RepID=UPI00038103CA|nr:DNA cytosine methyltransferase [Moraxella boevrei]
MYRFIDLFAGCGGLSEGFHKNENFEFVSAVEWEKEPVANLIHRLKTKYNEQNADKQVLRFDIQRTDELLSGWQNDKEYGSNQGLDFLVNHKPIDVIIGGPPCQAYSMAGRVQDKNGMKDDYRNYLFESYVKVVQHYQPKLFVFENVVGMLSAKPKDTLVIDLIRDEFDKHGYAIVSDLKKFALQDLTRFGVPQKRRRVIIIGIRKGLCANPKAILQDFYTNILPKYYKPLKTVQEAIGDLPKLYPTTAYRLNGKNYSHTQPNIAIANHLPRFHNVSDIETFQFLAKDIETARYEYVSTEKLKQLYTQKTGKNSAVHKYYVLRRDEPSNTIPAHLYKDGLRHIHYDSEQARSITVRESARLQTFDDDYEFISSVGANYKMIGNAVPPLFSEKLACALFEILKNL